MGASQSKPSKAIPVASKAPKRRETLPPTSFLDIGPVDYRSLPFELVEQVLTEVWLLPCRWDERRLLQTSLCLVSKTWKGILERILLLHPFLPANYTAIQRFQQMLSRRSRVHPGRLSVNALRAQCASLSLRLDRGYDLVKFMNEDAMRFISSFPNLTRFGIDFTHQDPTVESNGIESRAGLTTLSVILTLMEYARNVSHVDIKLGCPTMQHPEFNFGVDLTPGKEFPAVMHLSIDTDDGSLAHQIVQKCYNVRHLRLTCAYYGIVTELSNLLPWMSSLTLVVIPHPTMSRCAHADAPVHAPLANWAIRTALSRGLLERGLRGPHGTLYLEGADAIALACEDSASYREVCRSCIAHGITLAYRPLQEPPHRYAQYLASADWKEVLEDDWEQVPATSNLLLKPDRQKLKRSFTIL